VICDIIEKLRRFPQDASLEKIGTGFTVVTVETYNGEYMFDLETPSNKLPNFAKPDKPSDLILEEHNWDEVDEVFSDYDEDSF
jgi:hypothetical protein